MRITDEIIAKAFDAYTDNVDNRFGWDGMRAALSVVAPLIRSAALEEAAMVAQRMADDNSLSGGEPWICEIVARDIRALKDKEPTP